MAEWPCCHDPLRFSPVSLRFVPPPLLSSTSSKKKKNYSLPRSPRRLTDPPPAMAFACPCLACLALGCGMPMPWLLHAHGGLPWQQHAHALAAACPCLGCCLGLGMPMPWLPWPWLLHAHALAAACPWGGCLGLGCCIPMPWLRAHGGGCLGLGCCMHWPWLPCPQRRLFGHGSVPKGMPACTPRRIAPHRPALRQNWLVPFSIFVSLNSVHDFRGGFQQAVRHSERF